MNTIKISKIIFSVLFFWSTIATAQHLTISTSGGDVGPISGTNWGISDNVLYVGSSGSASINASVITNHLQNTGDLTINLPGQLNVARNININSTIAYSGSSARTLTFQSGNDIVFANAVGITSATASLNIVLRSATTTGTPDNGSVKMDGINIDTKGGHLWVGGGASTTTWNGLNVGNTSARTYLDDVAGISVVGSSIATNGGNISLYAQSFNTGDADGINYGINFENSVMSSGTGSIYFAGGIYGQYTNGTGMRVYGTTTTSITSTTGAIYIYGYGTDSATNGNSWRIATTIQGTASIKSESGAISVIGDAAFAATVNDKEGLMIANGAAICSKTGNITLRGTNTLETSGQYCNSIRFTAADLANSIRIGYDGTNAYSGNISIEGNSIYQRNANSGAGSIAVQTTGTLTIQPTGTAFTYMRASDAGTLTFDNDWNFGTTLGGFVYGKSTNTTALTYSNSLATSGPITMYVGTLTQNGAVSSGGAITFNSTDFNLGIGTNISTSTASDITFISTGNFLSTDGTRRTISSANGNIIINADSDANGTGTLSLDYLTFNPGTGATIIRGETVSYNIGSVNGPYINGTGSFTFQSSDASFGPGIYTTWFEIDQDNNGIGGLTLGKIGNTTDIQQNTSLTVAGPVNMYGGNIVSTASLTATNSDVSLYASTAVTQTSPIIAAGLSLNGTGTFTLTNTSNNFTTLAGGAVGSLLGATQIVDVSGGLTIGTIGSNSGLKGASTIRVETLAGNLTLAGNISTTSTSTDAVILTAAKSTAIGVGTGGDVIISGTPSITMGTGGIAKLFSGYDVTSTGLSALVGGASNVRINYDETSTTFNPVLSANNKYAIYRNAFGYGDLTIVSSGGDAEGTTWTYENGVIKTTNGAANVLNTVVQTKLNSANLSIEANKIIFNANVTGTTSNALNLRSKTHIVNSSATTITTAGGNVLFASNVDDATDNESIDNGYIQFENGLTVTTNGGNITLGGGDAAASSYALGASTTRYEGIRVAAIINLNSGGGNIIMRGKSYNINTNSDAWGVGFISLTTGSINSGTGTVLLDGYSQSGGAYHNSGLFSNGDLAITSANTTADAIKFIGKCTGTSGDSWGIEAESGLSLIATGLGGGITMSSSQQNTTSNHDVVLRGETNILAKSGPINLLGGQSSGIAGGQLWLSGNYYIGSKASSAVTSSSSNITLQYDYYNWNGGSRYVATSGTVDWKPVSPSFTTDVYVNWFNWNQNGQTMTGLTVGKPGCANWLYHQTNAITVAGPISYYGGYVGVSGNLTSSANGDILLKGIYGWNDVEVSSTISKTAGTGTLTMQANGRASFSGPITASGTGVLNVVVWSDYDGDNGDGGSTFSGAVNTNGGHVWMGGSNSNGGSYIWKGLTVGDGPSVGGSNANAVDLFNDVTTNGGDCFVWAGNGNGGVNGIAASGTRVINTGAGNITFIAPTTSGTIKFTTTGQISLAPNGGSYPGALTFGGTLSSDILTLNTSYYNGLVINNLSTVGGLTIGKFTGLLNSGTAVNIGNTSDITISSALATSGSLSLNGGNIAVNSALTATNNNISLNATGAVTQTGAITANNLELSGAGTFTLTNTSNNVGTIAGGTSSAKLGSISYIDSNALTIGALTNLGIIASGKINIQTLTNNLNLSNTVATDNTTTDAIILNAGKSTDIGSITGGDIVVSGTPSVTTGTNGIAKLFSGANGSSTGLTSFVGGNANTRYYYDENSTSFSPVLVNGNKYALYRYNDLPPANCLNFDGTNDYTQIPYYDTFASNFTVETWIKTTSSASRSDIVSWGNTSTGQGSVSEFRLAGGKLQILCNGSGSVTSSANVNTGKWIHVAVVKNGTTYSLYINGVLDGSSTIAYSGYNLNTMSVGGLYYAGTWSADAYFPGNMDEMRFWNTARTPSEIQTSMYNEISASTIGLVHYYNFNNSGSTLTDSVITGTANGTLSNFALTGTSSNWVESYAMVVPTALSTSAINFSSFKANWTAPVPGTVDNYLLDIATDAAFTSMVSGYNALNIGTVTSYSVSNLNQNTTYYWRVRAEKASVTGQGGYSAVQTVTTPQEPLNVTSTTTTNTLNLLTNAAVIVDPNIAINYSRNITGFSVVLSNGKQNGDVLSYTGTLPSGVLATAYNSTTGVLSFTGTTTPANWQALLRTVTFRAYTNAGVNRSISFSAGTLNSFTNGHYYELVSTADTWTNSKTAAANKKYLNYTGYLATVSSQAENDYIKQILTANAWMGATDEFSQINTATGATTYANQGASEGQWYWVTGPEAGLQFASSNTPAASVSGSFNNWYSGEPNNSSDIEHFGQFYYANNGTWNDLPNSSTLGYIVEYGGMANDIVQSPSYTTTMSVSGTPPGNALSFDGTNDYISTPTQVTNPTTFTLEAWFNTTASTSGGIVGFNGDQYNALTLSYDRIIWMSADGKINFGIYNGSTNILTSANAYNDGKYHHVAATFTTTQGMKLYIDGTLIGSNTLNSAENYNGYWKIGGFRGWANGGTMDYFNGKIDEVRIWSTVRTQTEIQNNMLNVVSPTASGLSYYYNFDQGTPSGTNTGNLTLFDQTTNVNNGTLNGFALSNATSNWVESYAMVVPKTATTTAITSSGFTANWSSSTIGTADNYLLDVSTNAGFTSFVSGYNNKNVGTSTSFTVAGLAPNSTYYWRVRADKASVTGQGGYSTQTVLTSKEPINITSTTTTNTFNLLTNSALIVDPNLAINYSQNIDGFRVIITTNKQDGDLLAYTGTLPSGISPVAYNASTGVLAFTGSTSAANWQTFLRTITFRGYKNSGTARSISFSAGSLNSFSNGHFYEYVASSSITWANAKTAAAARTYLNYSGYLTTVTSADENNFIKQILTADAWMGASDDYLHINAATGATTYASQSGTNQSEGNWYWVTGPEAGTQFWNGNGSGSVLSGKYANWYTPSSEPNNAGTSEHYGQFYSTNNGTWNDLNNTATLGYLVEYGGLSTDIVQTPSYSVTMNVTATEPGNALNFNGTNSYVNIPDANSLDLTTNYTIEAWIKPESFTLLGGIVDKYQTDNSKGYSLRLTGSAPYSGISFDEMSTANGILTANKWYHIAAVNTNGTRTLYVNGVSVPLTGTATIVLANTDPVRIGCDFSTRIFDGNIDEVRIWNVARSQSQIVANMNGTLSPSTANLVSYYNFNQGITDGTNTGLTTLYDQTTTLNNGTLNNFGLSGTTTNWVESYSMVVPTTTAATSKYSLGFTANWTASTIGTTEKYYLDVATDAAFTSLVSGYSSKDVGDVTSFDVNTGLSANTTYYYRVRAEKSSVTETGAYSNSTSVTTNSAETLVANAASDRTSVSFTANWSEPTLNNISAYLLDVSTVSDFSTFVSGYEALSVAGLSQSVTGLTPDMVYYYRITVPEYTNSNTITTSTIAPFASIATSVSEVCIDGTSPTITFTGSGSLAPYTFIYTINGGSNQTIATTSGNTVTLSVPTDTAGTFTYSLVSITDASSGTNQQSDATEIIVNPLLVPTFSSAPATTICSSTDVTYTTQSGKTNYVWTLAGTLNTDYTITSGGIGTNSSTVTLKWLTTGSKTVTVDYTNSTSCTSVSPASAATTVSLTPTVAVITGTTTTTEGLSTTLSNSTLDGVWSSSDSTIASISSTGVVTAVGQGTATITYTVTSGSCSNFVTTTYIVDAAPVPTITAVSPLNPVVGATVTVTGTNFLGASLVTVGTYQVTFTIVSATSITFTLPTGTGTNLAVAVTTPGGTATSTSPNLITYNTALQPTITSFLPTSAGTGQTVVITGTNLTNPSTITFGGTDVASYTVNSDTQITVVIGSGTSGNVVVTTAHPTPASKTGFTYLTCSGNTTLYSGGALSMCASESPFNITTDANASNYSALTWSTSGTGTFESNTTTDALTNTTYAPSNADIAAGSVIVTLTATANSGCLDQTSSKTLTIYPSPVGGTISGSSSVCTGSNSTTLTLTANVGTITKWQSSASSDFSTTIADIANTTTSLTASNLIATTYYRVVLTSGSCSDAYSDVATITVNPTSVAGSITGATTVCSGTNSTDLTLSGNIGDVTKWQYSSDNFISDTNDVSNTTITLTAENLTATTYYRAVVTSGSCSSATTATVTITVISSNIWNGSVSNDWNTADNWNCGVPASGVNIEIPTALTNYPELDSARTIGNVILASGATLNLNNFTLEVLGSFSGTGTLIGSNTSSLSINGTGEQGTFYMDQTTPGATNVLANFTLNSTSSGSATLGNALDISEILTLTNGTFNTGNNLTLKSSASGTAVVAPIINSSAISIIGDVTVERFVPANRAYRFLSPSVTSNTSIKQNWQENGSNTVGIGTHITGTGASTNGFDATATNNPSMFSFNNTTGKWEAVTNTNVNVLIAGTPYRLMVRGDRFTDLTINAPTASPTVLRATGALKTGDFHPTLNQTANGYSFVGNPYQAPIDIKAVLTASTNMNTDVVYYWDPTLNDRGAYVTRTLGSDYNSIASDFNQYLQPGQAVFVKKDNTANVPIMTITENDKSIVSATAGVFRNASSNEIGLLRANLKASVKNQWKTIEGALALFHSNYSWGATQEDANKLSNLDEEVSFVQNNTSLAIAMQSNPALTDELPIKLNTTRYTNYQWQFELTNYEGLTPYLFDAQNNTFTKIDNNTTVPFTVNGQEQTRFKIIFQDTALSTTDFNNKIVLYPNPGKADSSFYLTGITNAKVTLCNLLGQNLPVETTVYNSTIKVKPSVVLVKGVYLVCITQEGKTAQVKWIVE